MVIPIGMAGAEPENCDDLYYDDNPCDWSEFEGSELELKADVEILREKALKVIPAAGDFLPDLDDKYDGCCDCCEDEFEDQG